MAALTLTFQSPIPASDSFDRIRLFIIRGETDQAINELQRLKADPDLTTEMLRDKMAQVADEVRRFEYNQTGCSMSITSRLHTVLCQASIIQ